MLRGYHYTSWDNWLKIREEGLRRYLMVKPEFAQLQEDGILPNPLYGVWIWPNEPEGLSHMGNLVFQMSSKGATRVVKLAVEYDASEILRTSEERMVKLYHDGNISAGENGGHLRYHSGEEGLIIAYDLPPDRITLEKEYNLTELLA